MKKLYATISLVSLIGFACTKDQEAPHNVSIKQQNIAGVYLLVGFTSKTAAYPEVDLINTMDVCRLDNEYVLRKDGSFAVVDAGVQCSDTTNSTGTWQLLNGATLRLQDNNYTILNFQGKLLTVSKTALQSGEPITITKRFLRL